MRCVLLCHLWHERYEPENIGRGMSWTYGRVKRHLIECEWIDEQGTSAIPPRTAYLIAEDLARRGLLEIRSAPTFDVVMTEKGRRLMDEMHLTERVYEQL